MGTGWLAMAYELFAWIIVVDRLLAANSCVGARVTKKHHSIPFRDVPAPSVQNSWLQTPYAGVKVYRVKRRSTHVNRLCACLALHLLTPGFAQEGQYRGDSPVYLGFLGEA